AHYAAARRERRHGAGVPRFRAGGSGQQRADAGTLYLQAGARDVDRCRLSDSGGRGAERGGAETGAGEGAPTGGRGRAPRGRRRRGPAWRPRRCARGGEVDGAPRSDRETGGQEARAPHLRNGASALMTRSWTRVFDAVIVGGGPAGAATAIALSQRGLTAAIVDRAPEPA